MSVGLRGGELPSKTIDVLVFIAILLIAIPSGSQRAGVTGNKATTF